MNVPLHPMPPVASPSPVAMPSPFDEGEPHAWAQAAAEAFLLDIAADRIAPGFAASTLWARGGGKMFGVLVVRRPNGEHGVLRAVSGTIDGRWHFEGLVPPAFDLAARESFEAAGDAEVKALQAAHRVLAASTESVEERSALAEVERRHSDERAAMQQTHADRRATRHEQRRASTDSDAMHRLDQESRADKAERRRLDARYEEERAAALHPVTLSDARLAALEAERQALCRSLMQRIHDSYRLPNAKGERRSLRSFFEGEPPAGGGDCAGVKLLAYALSNGLVPVAMAEFWWGAPPLSGGRLSGNFYPSCSAKCGPLLPWMLQGVEVTPPRKFQPIASSSELTVVAHLGSVVVVFKPAGQLSIPGKVQSAGPSVLQQLRARFPDATGPLLVHRLDLDTSGLLVAALDSESHAHLQRQFAAHTIEKRYVAWVEGVVTEASGEIALPLRVDLDDRPRQLVDHVHGLPAHTRWQLSRVEAGRSRILFFPRTGRTHQLRVHAAHPDGLGHPIVGDRLYGREGERLMLHAEAIAFTHPETHERIAVELPAGF